jgi:perosamine synthetase
VPEIRGNEWRYIKEALDTNWVSSVGPFVDRFERVVAERVGVRHAVATVNGTAALHVALMVSGVQPDDEVIVSDLTFVAPVNAIRYVGGWPVFMDAEPDHWQMDPEAVSIFLKSECTRENGEVRNRVTGRRVTAILPVHILGQTVDMDPILDLAARYSLPIIEDATECLGATYHGHPAGSMGNCGCFSFNGNKIITTGGGGMFVTDDEELARRVRYLTTQAKDDPLEMVHGAIGYNYRLTSIQAAMGCAQMELLDEYVAAKHRIAARYDAAFSELEGIEPMKSDPRVETIHWMYTVMVDEANYGMNSRALMRHLAAKGVQTRPLWQPMHLSPAHKEAQSRSCSVADGLFHHALSLPCSVGLHTGDQDRVIEEIRSLSSSQGAGHTASSLIGQTSPR